MSNPKGLKNSDFSPWGSTTRSKLGLADDERVKISRYAMLLVKLWLKEDNGFTSILRVRMNRIKGILKVSMSKSRSYFSHNLIPNTAKLKIYLLS